MARSGLWLIVRRSLRQHALSTAVTVLSVGLASGLAMSVFAISKQTYDAFTGGPVGFDAVLGARGSQLQLVLNTVFHLETSPGNIPWSMYKAMAADRRVKLAIPYAVGDNYRGYRVVGTTPQIFSDFEYQVGKKLTPVTGGRPFDPSAREAVVGSQVAARLGLTVGEHIPLYHGVVFDSTQRHNEQFTIVGVLQQTNTPSDRVVWIPIEAVYRMSGHVLRGTGQIYRARPGEEIPEEAREVSAVMIKLVSPQSGMSLDAMINRQGKVATLAWPIAKSMADLFNKIGWVNRILELVAYLVVAVAAGCVLASIYNTMNERRREFAILRALGARRATVFVAIVLESTVITAMGVTAGIAVYVAILGAATAAIRAQVGVVLDPFAVSPPLILAPVAMLIVGGLAGFIPAFKAYNTDVASHLVPIS